MSSIIEYLLVKKDFGNVIFPRGIAVFDLHSRKSIILKTFVKAHILR